MLKARIATLEVKETQSADKIRAIFYEEYNKTRKEEEIKLDIERKKPSTLFYKMFSDSMIAASEERQAVLRSFLNRYERTFKEWSLIYRSNEHGSTPDDFHRRCDNKGPTLTLV